MTVTPLGLGLAALGRPGYINLGHAEDLNREYDVATMESHAHSVLDEAWQRGIRYFDAARSYGRAEQFLGSWLRTRGIPAGEVTVGSKWGYTYTAGWQVTVDAGQAHEVKEHSLPVLERQIGETRTELGGYLNLYQVHSATLKTGVLENDRVLRRLAELRAEGVLIGLSLSGAKQPETLWKALEVEVDGVPLFGSVQATWNLLERSAGPALQAASDAGWGVIVKEALANGRLTPRNRNPAFAEKRALLKALAVEQDTTMDALALAAVLAQPWASVVLSGAARTDHLRSNCEAVAVTWTDDLADAVAGLTEAAEAYWQTRSDLPWN